MVSKKVTTTIDPILWKEAQLHDIEWARAIETGVKLLLGSSNEKKTLKEKTKNLRIQLDFYSQRLSEIEKIETGKKLQEEVKKKADKERKEFLKKHNPTFKLAAKVLGRDDSGRGIGDVYAHWEAVNKKYQEKFGDTLQQTEFMKICEAMK